MKNVVLVLLAMLCPGLLMANDELVKASLAGDFAKVKSLVEGGANVNYADANGSTPIAVARNICSAREQIPTAESIRHWLMPRSIIPLTS